MNQDHYVMDIETLVNCTVYCFEHYKTDEKKVFVIHELRNEFPELLSFLENNRDNNQWHIGFNNLAFDSQISEFILRNKNKLLRLSPKEIANAIYNKAQDCIDRSNRQDFQEFYEGKLSIRQIDLFKMNHWDNQAKSSSLKWIQFTMDWHNVQEMPLHHSLEINSLEAIDLIIDYCQNDVSSTKRIMELCKDQIKLRAELSKEYKINLYSASEPKISKELFMEFLSEATGTPKYQLKQLRTYRNSITVSDIILPYINFQTETFQDLLDNFKSVVIRPESIKGSFKYSLWYKGIKTDFGLGGVHGAGKAGVYEAKDGYIIMSSDVTSYYPNLAIRNKWAPAHLPKKAFCDQYEWFFEERKKIAKSDPRNYVLKIILNSTFGLSIDRNSFLYDPQLGMQITINGQLMLMMLYEMLAEGIPGAIPIMQNTDGLEMMIPERYQEKYLEICKQWEEKTSLNLEHAQYSKIFLSDCNNYIAVFANGKTKCKGRFEFEDLALHKNKSSQIIPKAIYAYFVNGIPPERFLLDNRNIFDYCIGVKAKGDWEFREICSSSTTGITDIPMQRMLRYYVSNKGCKLVKKNKDDLRQIQLESGPWMMTVMNQYVDLPWEQYDVNDDYYLESIYKEITNISPPPTAQLQLF